MCTMSFVRRHISLLPEGQLFTTRALLLYGSRSAVDSALFRLVRAERIRRLARGVFIRIDSRTREPSVNEVATIKAVSFGRQIFCHGETAGAKLGLIDRCNRQIAYAIDGRSSSFRFGNITIHFRSAVQRKLKVGDGQVGRAIRALWYVGAAFCDTPMAKEATRYFTRKEIDETLHHYGLLPAWMQKALNWPQLWRVKHLLAPRRPNMVAAVLTE